MRTNNQKRNIFITILLFIIGSLVFSLITIIGFIYSNIANIFKKDFKGLLMYYENIIYKSVAIQDQISNVVAFEIIENIMIDKTKNYYKFGNERDTLSRAIGENYKKSSLTNNGLRINSGMDFFLGLDHSVKSTIAD